MVHDNILIFMCMFVCGAFHNAESALKHILIFCVTDIGWMNIRDGMIQAPRVLMHHVKCIMIQRYIHHCLIKVYNH